MESPFIDVDLRREAPNRWAGVRTAILALAAGGVLVGCDATPKATPAPEARVESTSADPRLPNTTDLARISQIDGSALGWTAASGDSDEPDPESGSQIESPVAIDGDLDEEGLILARGTTAPPVSPALTLPVAELQAMLSELASAADDPTPYELAAALLPLVAVPELVEGSYPEYAPRIGDLSSEEESLVLGTAEFASAVRRRLDAGEAPRTVVSSEIARLQRELRDDDGFQMPTIAMCSAIRGFGDFDEMPRRLPTRVDRDALIYVALDGLDWRLLEDGTHGWRVDHRIELRQLSDGFVVDPGRWAVQTHALPEPSRDAFFWVKVRLPIADLSAGRYALKVRVREPSSGRELERSLDLELVPPRLLTGLAVD